MTIQDTPCRDFSHCQSLTEFNKRQKDLHQSLHVDRNEEMNAKCEPKQTFTPSTPSRRLALRSPNIDIDGPNDVCVVSSLKNSACKEKMGSTAFQKQSLEANEGDYLFEGLERVLQVEACDATTHSGGTIISRFRRFQSEKMLSDFKNCDAFMSPTEKHTETISLPSSGDTHENSPETFESTCSSQRSKELLSRAYKILGKASLTLSSSKKFETTDDNDSLPRGKTLFPTQDENVDETTVSNRKVSFSPVATTSVAESLKSTSQRFTSENDSDGGSTMRTISILEQDFSVGHVYMHAPYRGANDHYPDPDLILSMISSDSSPMPSTTFLVRETSPWEQGESKSNTPQTRENEVIRCRPQSSRGNLASRDRRRSSQHNRCDFQSKDDVEISCQKFIPFVGSGHMSCVTCNSCRRSLGKPQHSTRQRERFCLSDASENFSDDLPTMSSISPVSSNDSYDSSTSSVDGLFESPGNDSMSTLSFGTAFNSNRFIQFTNAVCHDGSHPKGTTLHKAQLSMMDEQERRKLHRVDSIVAREAFYRAKSNERSNSPYFFNARDDRETFDPDDRTRNPVSALNGVDQARGIPSGGLFGRSPFRGMGTKYVADEETPRASCLGMLFSGSRTSVRLGNESQGQRDGHNHCSQAHFDAGNKGPSRSHGPRREIIARGHSHPDRVLLEKSNRKSSSQSPRGVQDFPSYSPRDSWPAEPYFF